MAVSASKANGAWNCAQKYVEDDGVRKENGNLSVVHTRLFFLFISISLSAAHFVFTHCSSFNVYLGLYIV